MITVGDQQIQWHHGMKLDNVMTLVDGGHDFMVVRLNGKLISRPNFSQTSVPDGAKVEPLPLIAGG